MAKIPLIQLGQVQAAPSQPFIQPGQGTEAFRQVEKLGAALGEMVAEKQRVNDNGEAMKLFTDATVQLAEAEKGFDVSGLSATEKTSQLRVVSKEIFQNQTKAASNPLVQAAFEAQFSQHTRSRLTQRIGEEAVEFAQEKGAEIVRMMPEVVNDAARAGTDQESALLTQRGIAWLEGYKNFVSPTQLAKLKNSLEQDVRVQRMEGLIAADPFAAIVKIAGSEEFTLKEQNTLEKQARAEIISREAQARTKAATEDREKKLLSEETAQGIYTRMFAGEDGRKILADPTLSRLLTASTFRQLTKDADFLSIPGPATSDTDVVFLVQSEITVAETPEQLDSAQRILFNARGQGQLSDPDSRRLFDMVQAGRVRLRTEVRTLRKDRVTSAKAFVSRFLTVSGPAAILAPEKAVVAKALIEYNTLVGPGGIFEKSDPMNAAVVVLKATVRSQMAARSLTLPQLVQSLRFETKEDIRAALGKGIISARDANLAAGFIEIVQEMQKIDQLPGETPESAAAGAAELRTPQRKRKR